MGVDESGMMGVMPVPGYEQMGVMPVPVPGYEQMMWPLQAMEVPLQEHVKVLKILTC